MKSNKYFLIIFLLLTNAIFAQNIKVIYSAKTALPDAKFLRYFTKDAIKELQKKFYHSLVKNDSCSVFFPITKSDNFVDIDTTMVSEDRTNITKVSLERDIVDIYYIDYKKKVYIRKISIHKKIYDIKDSIPRLNWTILNEKQEIYGYPVQKATTTYQGIKITAWFSEDIPVNIGPRIFTGLPGLIMKLKMNQLTYEAEKIEFLKETPHIVPPVKDKPYINSREYWKISKKSRVKSRIIHHKCSTCPKGMN